MRIEREKTASSAVIIKGMINYTKIWWLLGCHQRAEKLHSLDMSGNRVLVSQSLFIKGKPDDPNWTKGLIHKYNRYVRFRLSYLKFWEKEYSEERLSINRQLYNAIYEVCVQEEYITKVPENNWPTTINPKAYNIRGFPLGYFNGLAKTYDKVTLAIGAFIIALIGSSFVASWLAKKDNQPQTPSTINYFTIPDNKPIIEFYPNASSTRHQRP